LVSGGVFMGGRGRRERSTFRGEDGEQCDEQVTENAVRNQSCECYISISV
jgi:hypothetical protein